MNSHGSMGESMRAAGLATGVGLAAAVFLLAYRVSEDSRMVWAVVLTTLATIVLGAVALAAFMVRQAVMSWTVLLARNQEDRLMAARVARTWPDQAPAGGQGGGLLSQLLAGQGGQDVIDGTGLSWPQARLLEDDNHEQ